MRTAQRAVHKENKLQYVKRLFIYPLVTMEREEIRKAASLMTNRYSLLSLLNALKEDDLGEKAHPFTMAQLNYFCHPERNARHYKVFTIPKKSGGVREISSPVKMLKSFQTYTNILLQALYEPTTAAMGFVPGRSVVNNAVKHVGMNYVLNIDLKDFFPSIPQARVWGALQSKAVGFNQDVANAVAGLCCTEIEFYEGKPVLTTEDLPDGAETEKRNVLPQGAPTSPILTNIVARNLDRQLKHLAARFGLNYTRYADDITFSSMHNVYQVGGEFMTELRRIVTEQNFSINEKKTRLQKKGSRQEVTGLVVNDRINVTREYVRSIGSLLYVWERYGYDSAFARFLQHYSPKANCVSPPPMERVLQGKLMYLKMVKGEESPVWQKLQNRFEKLCSKTPEKKSDINYVAAYTMPAFEKQFSTEISFFAKEFSGKKDDSPVVSYGASFKSGDEDVIISVSNSCKKLIASVIDDDKAVAELKKKLYIAYCKRDEFPYWLVMKSRPRYVYASTVKRESKDLLFFGPDLPDFDEENPDATHLIKEFVESGFDMKILEQWSSQKNT